MPELPEVETTVRRLEPELVGRTITTVQIKWPRHVVDPELAQAHLPGRRVTGLGRRGKYVIIHLEPSDLTILIHLRMSGRLEVLASDAPPDKHAHTALLLDNGQQLRFSDTRKFGRLLVLADPETVLGKLGVEPLSDAFTVDWLTERMAKRKRMVKALLMDQEFIAGLGNIYADESLYRAGVDPRRPANSLGPAELARLHAGIQDVLGEAIEHQGTSLDWVYPGGEMQLRLHVYGRGGEFCVACGTEIQRIVLGQRGTHFCPVCQN
jgi:formamidopyrimidine-DNA glycosylase